MAAEIKHIIDDLKSFLPLKGKSLIHVGIGGGLLLDYVREAEKIMAVDIDAIALDKLSHLSKAEKLTDQLTVFCQDILTFEQKADVLLLEFCMHEMDDPEKVLKHVQTLAKEILIIDHAKGSEWLWYTCEEVGLERSWKEIKKQRIAKSIHKMDYQYFNSFHEMVHKIDHCGELAKFRSKSKEKQTKFKIEMPYEICLLDTK